MDLVLRALPSVASEVELVEHKGVSHRSKIATLTTRFVPGELRLG